jgi:hypothetical protein
MSSVLFTRRSQLVQAVTLTLAAGVSFWMDRPVWIGILVGADCRLLPFSSRTRRVTGAVMSRLFDPS